MNNNTLSAYKNLTFKQNVSFRVIDEKTGKVVQEHEGHNSATNSLLFGIAHHLVGDFLPNETIGIHPAYPILANYVPRYISLGTMGLINQNQDSYGLPAGIGDSVIDSLDPEYIRLQEAVEDARIALEEAKAALADDCQYWPACEACAECETCATRIGAKKQAVEDAQLAYDEAQAALLTYTEETRFVDYMRHRPGYGADGYDVHENNNRKYLGLGYAYTSYEVSEQYFVGDVVTYMGVLYTCDIATSKPAGPFNTSNWRQMDDYVQPSLGTTVKLELISPSFPRASISYRDIVPEYQSELPKTIDVVFSAMISTGALKQFRPEGQDYIFITEAGLWSKRDWEDSGENGLLAGYRIVPPNESDWDMTVAENRELLKRQILKVGKNQVVQVVWKIQIGAIEKFDQDTPTPDTYTKLSFYVKGSDTMGQLPGIVIKLTTDAEGQHTAHDARTQRELIWTTTDVRHDAYVSEGVYYMHQMSAAEGYLVSDPVAFELVDGEATRIGDVGIVEGTTVTMINEIAPDIPEVVYITNTGASDLYNARHDISESTYVRLTVPLYAKSDGYLYYNVGGVESPFVLNRSGSVTPAQFIDAATVIETNENDWPVYYYHGGLFTEANSIGFYDNNNFAEVLNALKTNKENAVLSLRDFDTSRITSLADAFEDWSNYGVFDFTNWDTSHITNMSDTFKNTTSLLHLYGIDSWDVSAVTTMSCIFLNAGSVAAEAVIADISEWNTRSVTNIDYMFSHSLIEPPANMDTRNVTSMVGVFKDYDTLIRDIENPIFETGLHYLNWNTSNATNMSYLYYNAISGWQVEEKAALYLIQSLDTSKATDMSYMFKEMNMAATLVDSNESEESISPAMILLLNAFDTSRATNMSHMFDEATLPVSDGNDIQRIGSSWNTRNVTNMSYMFDTTISHDRNIIFDITHWDLTSLLTAAGMFKDCDAIRFYDIGDTIDYTYPVGITDISSIYEDNDSMSGIPFEVMDWDLSHLVYMNGTWSGSAITHLDFSQKNLSALTEAHDFFNNIGLHSTDPDIILPNTIDFSKCEMSVGTADPSLHVAIDNMTITASDITNLKYFLNNSYIKQLDMKDWEFIGNNINLSGLFSGSRYLTLLDASRWDVSNVVNFNGMFKKSTYTEPGVLDFSSLNTWTGVSSFASFTEMCASNLSDVRSTDISGTTYRPYEQGYTFPDWSNQLVGNWNWTATGLSQVSYTYQGQTYDAWTFDPSDVAAGRIPVSGFGTLEQIITSNVSLTSTGIDTLEENIVVDGKFVRIEEESASIISTEFVVYDPEYGDPSTGSARYIVGTDEEIPFTSMEDFFENAIECQTTGGSTCPFYYNSGYYYCEEPLEFASNSNFDSIMTAVGTSTRDLSFHNWDTTKLTSLEEAFDSLDNLRSLDLTFTNTSNITNLSHTFNHCQNLIHIYGINNWDVSNVTTMAALFQGVGSGYEYAQSLEHNGIYPSEIGVDLTSWDTSSVVDLSYTFCGAHINIPIHDWNTSSVTTMEGTFMSSCSEPAPTTQEHPASENELITWDTSNVESMAYMFSGNGQGMDDDFVDFRRHWDFSNLDTSSVETMESMFENCIDIQGDWSDWNTSNVTNMTSMFEMFGYSTEDGHYTDIDSGFMGYWNTSNVYYMDRMFYQCGNRADDSYAQWDVSNVRSMNSMFYYAPEAGEETPYYPQISDLSNWNISNLEDANWMFHGCDVSSYWMYDYEGTECTWDLSALESAWGMFENARLGVGATFELNMPECTDIRDMFKNAYTEMEEPTTINLNVDWDSMSYSSCAFNTGDINYLTLGPVSITTAAGANKLKEAFQYESATQPTGSYPQFESLTAQNWEFTGANTSLSNLFSSCQNLKEINLAGWDVAAVTNFDRMFYKMRRYTNPASENPADTIYEPGVLDFSSLDDWNVSANASFVEMCRTNLDNTLDDGGEYYAFEQEYRFPQWSTAGHWEYTGLTSENVTSSHLSYYYADSYEDYTAHCFGTYYDPDTSTQDADLRMQNHPVVGFGTFTPSQSQLLFNWDFTDSLYDNVHSTPATFFSDVTDPTSETVTPSSGQFVTGTGLVMPGNNALHIPVDLLSKTTSYTVEIDFASDFEFQASSWNTGFIATVSPDNPSVISGICSDYNYCFSVDTYDPNGEFTSSVSNITSATFFASSTMKIVNRVTVDNNVVWDIYKNNTLAMTTDEYQSDQVTPFFWDNSSLQRPFMITSKWHEFGGTITGMRVYGTLPVEPRTLIHNYDFTSNTPFVDIVTGNTNLSVTPSTSSGTNLTIDSNGVTKIFTSTPDSNAWSGTFYIVNATKKGEIELEFGDFNYPRDDNYTGQTVIRIQIGSDAWDCRIYDDYWNCYKAGAATPDNYIYGLNRTNLTNSILTIRLDSGDIIFKHNSVILGRAASAYTPASNSTYIQLTLNSTGANSQSYDINIKSVKVYEIDDQNA